MKRLLSLGVIVLLLMSAFAPTAFAGWFWCEDDPLVRVITPAGNAVNVHVTNYGEGVENLAAVRKAEITYEVKPIAGGRGTAVSISVLIPNNSGERFRTRTVASTGPLASGVVLDEATGGSGKAMTLSFKLDIP
ncbi:MAG: hypothetical protein HYX94_00135 [Chloroflexi bacterium]|nr:hypothetical protein [Chloroflexota bacterium]